ncbi:MAG: 50S ribosomal protein L20 [Synergistales bacterium]|nr:50S ribosomal protein L20 [Synergistales bacterium]MDY6402268.1 50S ribosomal protein L20 [Synergistales bacterium]MDY6404953.1 50S ribosomal protein L20 [Synergistales bacterium]MDY6410350.1 50S ribosomal protein L20 [Synergistales bacterium]MDY6414302.1 50S ribosomal protein L20 [Synergistales bacterium]
MRVKGASASDKKREKLFKITKGYWGQRKNVYRRAREAFLAALSRAYVDRKRKKRDFRRLWITRISAAVRAEGMSYSVFMNGLKKAGINMNRKMLSELAIHDANAFRELVAKVKAVK